MSALEARLLVLTDRTLTGGRPLVDVVAAAVRGGARAVILREKDLTVAERAMLASGLRPIVNDAGGVLIVASDTTIPSDGVHLAAADPFPRDDRPAIVGRSCHSLAEVRAAQAEGCDYVTLSPIFASSSKPGYGPAIGLRDMRDIADEVTISIYALGGVDSTIAAICQRAGAAGVAVMGAVMCAEDPELRTHELTHEVRDCVCTVDLSASPAAEAIAR